MTDVRNRHPNVIVVRFEVQNILISFYKDPQSIMINCREHMVGRGGGCGIEVP